MVIVLIVKWSIPLIPVHTDNLLHETCNQDATPVLIEKALQPSYSYDHLGEKVNLKRISQEVTPEIAKTEFFAKVMECIIGDTYAFGRIKLPDGYKNPWTSSQWSLVLNLAYYSSASLCCGVGHSQFHQAK